MNRHGLRSLLHAWRSARARGVSCVLATVISTEGSSYRKAGARMLIELGDRHAQLTGIVGGGCFDDDLMAHARKVAAAGEPMVCRYDMRSDDDVLWGLGMGCNGAVDVFLQPVSDTQPAAPDDTLDLLETLVDSGGMLATTIVNGSRPSGSSRVIDPAPIGSPAAAETGLSASGEEFIDQVQRPFWLGLFGAGSDVLPLLDLADQLDWRVAIWDHRPGYARAERFPLATEVSAFADAPPASASRCDAIVVMSHNFDADRRFLASVAHLDVAYIGVLGPASRRDRLLEELGDAARPLQGRLRGPVGLDLGGELPEEVALSVIAQIQSLRNRRSASALDASLQTRGEAVAGGR